MNKPPRIEKWRFDPPDQALDFKAHGRIRIIQMLETTPPPQQRCGGGKGSNNLGFSR
jgi:hypothetical protein